MKVRFAHKWFLALTFALPVTAKAADVPTESIQRFLDGAHAIVAEINRGIPATDTIITTVDSILEDARPVVEAFAALHPQCAVQLARVLELYPQINTWTAQEIRRNIEAAAALPPADGCYPARDIVAHPSIVRALARAGFQASQRNRFLGEINEAIEHMEGIAEELSQQ